MVTVTMCLVDAHCSQVGAYFQWQEECMYELSGRILAWAREVKGKPVHAFSSREDGKL